jgi:hypothetical protein
MAPAELLGIPAFGPGWLETTTPVPLSPALFVFAGGARASVPAELPKAKPLFPFFRPERELASEMVGDGAITAGKLLSPAIAWRPEASSSCAEGGTTGLPPSSGSVRCFAASLSSCAGGGITCLLNSGPKPGPDLATSRENCGAGAITLGTGRVSCGGKLVARSGADTAGAMTGGVLPGKCSIATLWCGALGAGATTAELSI